MTGALAEPVVGVEGEIGLLLGDWLDLDGEQALHLVEGRSPLRRRIAPQHDPNLDQAGGGEPADLGGRDQRKQSLSFRLVEQNGDDGRTIDNHDRHASAWQTLLVVEKGGAISAFRAHRPGGLHHVQDLRDLGALGRRQLRRTGNVASPGLPRHR